MRRPRHHYRWRIGQGVVDDAQVVELLEELADVAVELGHAISLQPQAGLALRGRLKVGVDVHTGGVEPAEERLAGLVLPVDEVLSSAAGFTFNWENPDTDYTTGTEFHVEWALVQHFSKTFALGVTGYHYEQVTGDRGAGARLGDFEGRVTAVGPVLSYSLNLGKIPVSTQWTWFHEFDVENRAQGDAGLLTISMPLSVAGR